MALSAQRVGMGSTCAYPGGRVGSMGGTVPGRRGLVAPGREGDDVSMSSRTTFSSYEDACAKHRWEVPERYNIGVDVCDRHPREKLAMIHEDPDGAVREVRWG